MDVPKRWTLSTLGGSKRLPRRHALNWDPTWSTARVGKMILNLQPVLNGRGKTQALYCEPKPGQKFSGGWPPSAWAPPGLPGLCPMPVRTGCLVRNCQHHQLLQVLRDREKAYFLRISFSCPPPPPHPKWGWAQRLKTHSLTGNEELLPGPPSRENMNKMLHAANELPTLTAPGKSGRWATVPGTPIFVLSWASPWVWEVPGCGC